MSAKKTQSSSSPEQKPRWISVDLTPKQKADMVSRFPDPGEVFSWLHRLIESGYKVTQQWSSYEKCHACYIFPVGDEHANAGHILSNRGSTPYHALRGALYRHFVVFEENWGNREAQGIDED